MTEPTIRFQSTPNPNAGKFILDRRVIEGKASRSFYNANDAADHPLASAVFEIEGVASLFMADDFITVTKSADTEWEELRPRVEAAIRQAPR